MKDNNLDLKNAYFTEGFEYQKEGILRQKYHLFFGLDQDTTGFSDFEIVDGMFWKFEEDGIKERFYTIGGRKISRHYTLDISSLNDNSDGILHTIDDGGALSFCAYPGFIQSENGNILYTSDTHLGRGVWGTNSGDNQSNKVVDEDGRNLSNMGISVGDTVINIKDGTTAEITSISTTTETNDTLEFTGGWSDSGDIDDEENWVVFVDDWKSFGVVDNYNNHFAGQNRPYTWSRQITNFYGVYFIGNGNYISKLNNAEDTLTAEYSQLPAYSQFIDMDYNGAQILIGANVNKQGQLILWDGITQSGYLSIISLNHQVKSIEAYQSGWLVFAGATLYYTNGYTLKPIAQVLDTDEEDDSRLAPTGMKILNNKVFLNLDLDLPNRMRSGIHIYDFDKGWEYTPYINSSGNKQYEGTANGGIFWVDNKLFASYDCSNKNILSRLYLSGDESEALFYLKTGKSQINNIELTLGRSLDNYTSNTISATVIAGVADGSRILFNNIQANADSTEYNKFSYNTSFWYLNEGDMIKVVNGNASGQIAFVSSVDSGTVTLDRDLSAYLSSSDRIQIMPIKKMGEKTISGREFSNPYIFDKGTQVTGDAFIWVYIDADYDLEIRNIKVN